MLPLPAPALRRCVAARLGNACGRCAGARRSHALAEPVLCRRQWRTRRRVAAPRRHAGRRHPQRRDRRRARRADLPQHRHGADRGALRVSRVHPRRRLGVDDAHRRSRRRGKDPREAGGEARVRRREARRPQRDVAGTATSQRVPDVGRPRDARRRDRRRAALHRDAGADRRDVPLRVPDRRRTALQRRARLRKPESRRLDRTAHAAGRQAGARTLRDEDRVREPAAGAGTELAVACTDRARPGHAHGAGGTRFVHRACGPRRRRRVPAGRRDDRIRPAGARRPGREQRELLHGADRAAGARADLGDRAARVRVRARRVRLDARLSDRDRQGAAARPGGQPAAERRLQHHSLRRRALAVRASVGASQ